MFTDAARSCSLRSIIKKTRFWSLCEEASTLIAYRVDRPRRILKTPTGIVTSRVINGSPEESFSRWVHWRRRSRHCGNQEACSNTIVFKCIHKLSTMVQHASKLLMDLVIKERTRFNVHQNLLDLVLTWSCCDVSAVRSSALWWCPYVLLVLHIYKSKLYPRWWLGN